VALLNHFHQCFEDRYLSVVASNKDQFLATLVSAHGSALERYLARKLDSPEDAAEIAQEAFLRLHRMEAPENLDNARAFLFQVATNLAVDQLRRRKLHLQFVRRERSHTADSEPMDINASGVSPEHILAARQKLAIIYAAVDELPLNVRQAFLLHRRSGMSYSAIAQEMQVSVSSVEKYILQALQHCRKRLAAYYPPD
jgi:RNA polymerase sigma-70 factor (ECF subfamily)